MARFTLELYVEDDGDRDLAERSRTALLDLLAELAPHVSLEVAVRRAESIGRHRFNWNGHPVDVPYHEPSDPDSQTLLITGESLSLGAPGWGWKGSCVVSTQRLVRKVEGGGNIADLLIHEWLHTIEGEEINGRIVPCVDDSAMAARMGFVGTPGPDGDDTWHPWYRYVLGG